MSLKLSTFLWREQQAEETITAIWNVVLPIGEGFKEWDWGRKFVWNRRSKISEGLTSRHFKKALSYTLCFNSDQENQQEAIKNNWNYRTDSWARYVAGNRLLERKIHPSWLTDFFENSNNVVAIDMIYLGFETAFDKIPYKTLEKFKW